MFLYHQKCKKIVAIFIVFQNSTERGTKKTIFFLCPFCKMTMFLNFEEAASENAIIYLKRQQFVTKLRQQIKDQRIRL